jgi:hypothetical protein
MATTAVQHLDRLQGVPLQLAVASGRETGGERWEKTKGRAVVWSGSKKDGSDGRYVLR